MFVGTLFGFSSRAGILLSIGANGESVDAAHVGLSAASTTQRGRLIVDLGKALCGGELSGVFLSGRGGGGGHLGGDGQQAIQRRVAGGLGLARCVVGLLVVSHQCGLQGLLCGFQIFFGGGDFVVHVMSKPHLRAAVYKEIYRTTENEGKKERFT